jgi:hypothetical protein
MEIHFGGTFVQLSRTILLHRPPAVGNSGCVKRAMRKADSSPNESTLQPRQCSRHSVSTDMSSNCRVSQRAKSAEDRSAAYICSSFPASVVTSVVHRMSHHSAELADRSLAQSRPASGSVPTPIRGSLHRWRSTAMGNPSTPCYSAGRGGNGLQILQTTLPTELHTIGKTAHFHAFCKLRC